MCHHPSNGDAFYEYMSASGQHGLRIYNMPMIHNVIYFRKVTQNRINCLQMTTGSGCKSWNRIKIPVRRKVYLNSHQAGTNGECKLGIFDSTKSRSEIFSTIVEPFDFLTDR